MINPDANLATTEMQMPTGATDEDALKIMQLAIAAKAGKLGSKAAPKPDLMTVSTQFVKDYIIENIQQEGIDAFAQFAPKELGLTTKEAIAEHIGEAHKTIKTRKGDFERPIMPQAGGAGTDQDTVNNLLKKGQINFDKPSAADTK